MDHTELTIGRNEPPDLLFNTQRTQVLETLINSQGLKPKCVTAVAPVGYGKTIMMSMLLADLRLKGKQCHWLTLDERDTGIDSIIADLDSIAKSNSSVLHPTHALLRGYDSTDKSIDVLINALNSYPLPIIIFIDNLHCCRDSALEKLLEQLIYCTRPTIQLVFSSTQELPIDFPRAQLRGIVQTIGPVDLNFTSAEIAGFLGQELCQKITSKGVDEVARKTEGWPAAVRMAQIILTNTDNPFSALETFSGSDEALAQLLNRQVLSGFPVEIRQFLLTLSQLRTFCVELCLHAIENTAIREYLSYLIERNVFIVPLDRNRKWYRLHGLFRDHLLREAEITLPEKERQAIIIRARQWCEEKGYMRDAIDYAFASGLLDTATPILDKIAPTFIRNRGASLQYIGWVEMIHQNQQSAGLETEYWYAWALAFHRRYEKACLQIKKLGERLRLSSEDNIDLQRRIAILQASIDNLTDQLKDAHQGATQWLDVMQNKQPDSFNLTAAYCIQCCYFTHNFEFIGARQAIQSARETAFQANSPYVDGWVSCYSALIGISEGGYGSSYGELVAALTSTRAALGDDSGICGTMSLIAAHCAAQMGLDTEARQLLEYGSKSWRVHGFLDALACGIEAALNLWVDTEPDHLSLSTLREVTAAYPQRLSLILSCHLIRRLIVLNRTEEAQAEAASIALENRAALYFGSQSQFNYDAQLKTLFNLTAIELQIASGNYKQSSDLINDMLKNTALKACSANLVVLELNSAHIALKLQNQPAAVRHVSRAIRIASSRRILKPFINHSPMLGNLIGESKPSVWSFATESEQRFFADICQQLPASFQQQVEQLSNLHNQAYLLDKLTSREHELLSLIDTGLSNQQLADHLDLSLATVKWHIQNLYGKLGVSRRTAAIAKARDLNLINR